VAIGHVLDCFGMLIYYIMEFDKLGRLVLLILFSYSYCQVEKHRLEEVFNCFAVCGTVNAGIVRDVYHYPTALLPVGLLDHEQS